MNYESKAWAEAKGACLRNFNEQGDIDSVNGALALRPRIEKIVDQIWEEGFDNTDNESRERTRLNLYREI